MSELISKEQLSELLHDLEMPVGEGITSQEDNNKLPRVLYWPYSEVDQMASGTGYVNVVTYQISLFARIPQHWKYKELRNKLRQMGIHPTFYHEYVEKDPVFSKCWHTYCSIDVLEEIDEDAKDG